MVKEINKKKSLPHKDGVLTNKEKELRAHYLDKAIEIYRIDQKRPIIELCKEIETYFRVR